METCPECDVTHSVNRCRVAAALCHMERPGKATLYYAGLTRDGIVGYTFRSLSLNRKLAEEEFRNISDGVFRVWMEEADWDYMERKFNLDDSVFRHYVIEEKHVPRL